MVALDESASTSSGNARRDHALYDRCTVGQLEAEAPPPMGGADGDAAVVGRSPWQIARSRFRRDKVSMTAFVIVIIYVVVALSAPILDKLGVIDPLTPHFDLVGGIGSMPETASAAISADHPLGRRAADRPRPAVPAGLGRHPLDDRRHPRPRLQHHRSAASLGIIAGYLGGWADFWIGRFMDLILSFPQLLMLLALSPVLIDRITADRACRAATRPDRVYLVFVLGFFGFPYFARIIRGQVLSLREREFVEAAALARRAQRPDLVQGAAAQPVGADPGLHHADPAGQHLGRGGAELPRGRHQGADADPGQHPRRLGQLPVGGPDVLLPPGLLHLHSSSSASTCSATGCETRSTRSRTSPPRCPASDRCGQQRPIDRSVRLTQEGEPMKLTHRGAMLIALSGVVAAHRRGLRR